MLNVNLFLEKQQLSEEIRNCKRTATINFFLLKNFEIAWVLYDFNLNFLPKRRITQLNLVSKKKN